MVGCTIYDNKQIDTESDDFKSQIADAVRDLVIRDWDKISNVTKYEKTNNGFKEYYVEVTLWNK